MTDLNYIGNKYGYWSVKDIKHKNNSGHYRLYFTCICECGKEKEVRADTVLNGTSTNCGCKKNYKKIHGLTKTRLYNIWGDMKQRCLNAKSKEYHRYGGRGIKICSEWVNCFENFYNWSFKNGYSDELTIDRINNDGNYEPNNCRWVTTKEQKRNWSRNIFITYKGETKCVQDWCEKFGLHNNVVCNRYRKGFPLDMVFSKKSFKGLKTANYTKREV